MILDMVSETSVCGLNGLPDPRIQQVERDRALALEFVRRNEPKGGALQLSKETGVNYRTVYRAIERQLEWARTHLTHEEGGERDSASSPAS